MSDATLPARIGDGRISTVAQLAAIPQKKSGRKSRRARTPRAYRLDVQHFLASLHISSIDELRQADHKAVIAWERYMREVEHAAASTIRRRLAALSSLFWHLIDYGGAESSPRDGAAGDQSAGRATLAFSKG